MADSLLASLLPRIKGSQEDVATISLVFILERFEVLRSAFTRMLCNELQIDYETLSYTAQVTGTHRERPDIVGAKNGQEKIIIEAKFFASLTDNQPDTYLSRLEGQGGLIFLCPESRKTGLWQQLTDDKGFKILDSYCVDVNGTHMSIISWKAVFDMLKECADNHAPEAKADLHQLTGFCNEIESSSFKPFKAEDFGADIARSIDRYYLIVDETKNNLLHRKDISANKDGLHAQGQQYGHTQYITVEGVGLGIHFHRGIWKKCFPSSPFCINFFKGAPFTVQYINSLGSLRVGSDDKYTYIALDPPVEMTKEESAKYLADQIVDHVRHINELRAKANDETE